jgi:hypothetical protein
VSPRVPSAAGSDLDGVHSFPRMGDREAQREHFKASARERKCGRIVAHLDRAAELIGLKPHTADAGLIADALASWGDAEWEASAREAGTNVPGEETRAMVVAVYRERAKK